MTKEMIISSNGHETRVAILEDDQLAEMFVERERSRGVVGNVYKGRVSKVLPGMQSSFVDIGLERDGFLYVSDVIANLDEYDKDDDDDDRGAKGAKGASGANGAEGTEGAENSSAPAERRGRGRDRRDEEKKAPEPKIEELHLKQGYQVVFGGSARTLNEASNDFLIAVLLAVAARNWQGVALIVEED